MEEQQIDSTTLAELCRRARAQFRQWGLFQHEEDGAQAYAVHLLEGRGKGQTVTQFCIDYLRQFSGRKGQPGYEARCALENAVPMEGSRADRRLRFDPRTDWAEQMDVEHFLSGITDERERDILEKTYQGWLLEEIAEVHGITASRVSQIISAAAQERRMEVQDEEWIDMNDAEIKLGVQAQTVKVWIRDGSIRPKMREGKPVFLVSECDTINECRKRYGQFAWKMHLPWKTGAKPEDVPTVRKPFVEATNELVKETLTFPLPPLHYVEAPRTTNTKLLELAVDLLKAGHRDFSFRAFELAVAG